MLFGYLLEEFIQASAFTLSLIVMYDLFKFFFDLLRKYILKKNE